MESVVDADAFRVFEQFGAGNDDAVAGLEAFEHLDGLEAAVAEAYRLAFGDLATHQPGRATAALLDERTAPRTPSRPSRISPARPKTISAKNQ